MTSIIWVWKTIPRSPEDHVKTQKIMQKEYARAIMDVPVYMTIIKERSIAQVLKQYSEGK